MTYTFRNDQPDVFLQLIRQACQWLTDTGQTMWEQHVGIIHKLAIRWQFAGQNLVQPILDFCKKTCLERGIHEIQLETDATRPALMRFHERNEFTPLYQKVIYEFGQDFLCQYYKTNF